jgi:signal peptidase II
MIWGIIIVLIVALDQYTKYVIVNKINFGDVIPVIDKFFYLTYWENKGAAWGILQNGRIFFLAITVVIVAAMTYILYKSDNKILKSALSLVLGGALGNFIDRAKTGGVVDFLDFYLGSYHFPTFNVADTFVVIGTFLLAYYLLFIYKEKEPESIK